MNCKKNRKEHLFCNAIHGIIESVDKVKDQKRTVFMEKIDHNAHSVYLMYYHLIMVVKYRRKVLTPDLSNRLYELVNAIGNEKGFTVVDCKVGENDHVHCFVSAPPKISITQIVKYLKGISGNALLKEFPEIRQLLWKGHLWNGSYFCETIGSTSEENILKYIERQKNCQL